MLVLAEREGVRADGRQNAFELALLTGQLKMRSSP